MQQDTISTTAMYHGCEDTCRSTTVWQTTGQRTHAVYRVASRLRPHAH
jgi:hypothetical protein